MTIPVDNPEGRWLDETGPSGWVELPSDPANAFQMAESLGWGDGLPFIPPTKERIVEALEAAGLEADESLPDMPPSWSPVTAARVAANSVMAGCTPDLFRVVFTALGVMLRPEFNLKGVQATTHSTAPVTIIHGPIVEEAGFNSGTGTMGPGGRANATVGRAVRLCLLNIGSGRPGTGDMATNGSPAKYSFCFAERAESSPWLPYHVDSAGLDPYDSAVTVMSGENPHHVNDHVSTDAQGVLATVGSMLTVLGSNPAWLPTQVIVVLGPEHAAAIASSGFTRQDVQYWLYETARMPISQYKRGGMWGMEVWPKWKQQLAAAGNDDRSMCPLDSPDSFRIMVSGGPGKFSCVIPGDGMTPCTTVRLL
jgi:hypothetical protein